MKNRLEHPVCNNVSTIEKTSPVWFSLHQLPGFDRASWHFKEVFDSTGCIFSNDLHVSLKIGKLSLGDPLPGRNLEVDFEMLNCGVHVL